MIHFRPVEEADLPLIREHLALNPYRCCDFSVANIFMWRHFFKTNFAIVEDCLVLSPDDGCALMMPFGKGDPLKALDALCAHSRASNCCMKLLSVTDAMMEKLELWRPGGFEYQDRRDKSDYIYLQSDLASLKGKKFHSKRNHINRFLSNYSYSYEALDQSSIEDCLAMHETWCDLHDGADASNTLQAERFAVRYALENFEMLGLRGGVLRISGRGVVAFTIGVPLTADTIDICIEKALPDVEGAYAMINQQFAQQGCEGFTYLNREEDLGVEGLRKAKLSYQPAILLSKRVATPKKD